MKTQLRNGLAWVRKYRYVGFTILLGVVLLLWPKGREKTETASSQAQNLQNDMVREESPDTEMEQRLADLLGQIQGAGKVSCMVTFRDNGVREYLTDHTVESSGTERTQTVVLDRDQEGQETVLVTASEPKLEGVAVVCDGGEDPTVRLEIVRTITALTGLGSDHISVVKRESNQNSLEGA